MDCDGPASTGVHSNAHDVRAAPHALTGRHRLPAVRHHQCTVRHALRFAPILSWQQPVTALGMNPSMLQERRDWHSPPPMLDRRFPSFEGRCGEAPGKACRETPLPETRYAPIATGGGLGVTCGGSLRRRAFKGPLWRWVPGYPGERAPRHGNTAISSWDLGSPTQWEKVQSVIDPTTRQPDNRIPA